MPQELHVLRCYSCKMYQVQIVKKKNKWQCKICNEKQSIQAIYFRGGGSDCRNYVQEMNSRNSKETGDANFRTAVVEAWGLDCEADEDSSDACKCAEKRTIVDTLSHCLDGNAAERNNADKENFSCSQNPTKRRRIEAANRFFSQPSSSTLHQDFRDSSRGQRSSGKWEKFMDRPDKDDESPVESFENETEFLKKILDDKNNNPERIGENDGNISEECTTNGGSLVENKGSQVSSEISIFYDLLDSSGDIDLELDF